MRIVLIAVLCSVTAAAKSQAPKLSFIKNYPVHFQTYTGGDYAGEVNALGKPDGIGSMNYADTVWYVGQFSNGEINGEGAKLLPASNTAKLENFVHGETAGQFIATTGKTLFLMQSTGPGAKILRNSAITSKFLINSMYGTGAQVSKTTTILSLGEDDDISLYYCPKTDGNDFNGNAVVYKSVNAEVEFQKIPHGVYDGVYSENGTDPGHSLMRESHITAQVERITDGPLPLWLQDGIYLYKNVGGEKFFARGGQIANPGIFSMQYGMVANNIGFSNFCRLNPNLEPYGFMQDATVRVGSSYAFWLGDFTLPGNKHNGSGIVCYGNPNNNQYVTCMGVLQEDVAGLQTDRQLLHNGFFISQNDSCFSVTIGAWDSENKKGSGYCLDTKEKTFFRGDLLLNSPSGFGELLRITGDRFKLDKYNNGGAWSYQPQDIFKPMILNFDTGVE